MSDIEDRVREAIERIVDPETGMTFGYMNMIRDVKEQEEGVVKIDFVPSSPFCPIAFHLARSIRDAAEKVEGVKRAFVYCRGHRREKEINETGNR